MIMAKQKFVPTHLCTDCVALIIFAQSRVTPDLPLVMIIIKGQRIDIGINDFDGSVIQK